MDWVRNFHGLINYKDTKYKCHLSCRVIEFIDWRYSQSYSYFRPSFVNYCPSILFSCSPLPTHPPLPMSKHSICRQCVAGRGWKVLSCVGDHILQELVTLFLTSSTTFGIVFCQSIISTETLHFIDNVPRHPYDRDIRYTDEFHRQMKTMTHNHHIQTLTDRLGASREAGKKNIL